MWFLELLNKLVCSFSAASQKCTALPCLCSTVHQSIAFVSKWRDADWGYRYTNNHRSLSGRQTRDPEHHLDCRVDSNNWWLMVKWSGLGILGCPLKKQNRFKLSSQKYYNTWKSWPRHGPLLKLAGILRISIQSLCETTMSRRGWQWSLCYHCIPLFKLSCVTEAMMTYRVSVKTVFSSQYIGSDVYSLKRQIWKLIL